MWLYMVPIGHRSMIIDLFWKKKKRHTQNEVSSFDSIEESKWFGLIVKQLKPKMVYLWQTKTKIIYDRYQLTNITGTYMMIYGTETVSSTIC